MLTRRVLARYPIVRVSSKEQYLELKTASEAPVLVGWFSSKHSLACKLYEQQFDALAAKFPSYQFFKTEVDQAPEAAYDCEVTDVPQISVLPVGRKSDGALFDKSDLQTVKADLGRYDTLVLRASAVLADLRTSDASTKPNFVFDPATGSYSY